MIFGAVYRRKISDTVNDQHYYYYIPVACKINEAVKYGMVDTYMVRNPCWGQVGYAKKIWYLEQANCGETAYSIFTGSHDYYYKNYYNIGSLELDETVWEMVADLHEYRIISENEAREYLSGDLAMYIPLWNEDCYRWHSEEVGSCFVRKDVRKDGWKVYSKCLYDNYFDFKDNGRLNFLEENCKNVLANMKLGYGKKKEIRKTLSKIRKYRQLSKEYDKFCENLEGRD